MTPVEREVKKIVASIRRKANLTDPSVGVCNDEVSCGICTRALAARRILKRLRLRNID